MSQGHVALIVFEHGYGTSEFTRGSLADCLEQTVLLMREGAPYPPPHQPGAALRWYHFPHDGSHRTTLPGGELRILGHAGSKYLVHVRRDGCCVFGRGTELELFDVAEKNYSDFERLHKPLSVVHRGRRYNLQVTHNGEDIAAATAADGTRFAVRITGDDKLHLGRLSDGVRSDIRTIVGAFDDLPEILWPEEAEPKPQADPTLLAPEPVCLPPETHPTGPLHPEVRAATVAFFDYLVMLRGVGKAMRLQCRQIFEFLLDRGIRVSGRGEALRKQLVAVSGTKMFGCMRAFRYAMATCRRLGLLVSDGTLDVFPFDAFHDPVSSFARNVVAVFGKVRPAQPGNADSSASLASETAPHPGASQVPSGVPPEPPVPPDSTWTGDQQAQEQYPKDTWPFQDQPSSTPGVFLADGACLGNNPDACDPTGLKADEVNWFNFQIHRLDEFAFLETPLGQDVIKERSEPVNEVFYQNLADKFHARWNGSSGVEQ